MISDRRDHCAGACVVAAGLLFALVWNSTTHHRAPLPAVALGCAGSMQRLADAAETVGLPAGEVWYVREEDAVASKHVRESVELMRAGRYEDALPGLKTAARTCPLALGWLAECHYYLGQDRQALAACDKLAAADPKDGRSHYVRGLVLLRDGQAETAREQLKFAANRGEALAATVLGDE